MFLCSECGCPCKNSSRYAGTYAHPECMVRKAHENGEERGAETWGYAELRPGLGSGRFQTPTGNVSPRRTSVGRIPAHKRSAVRQVWF